MTYCTDADLVKYRPNILQLGVESWEEQREEAYKVINRVLETRWFRKVAPEMGFDILLTSFDPDLVKENNLTRLEIFKTLELIYMYLKKDSPEADGFERNEKAFRERYNEELEMVLSIGVEYDWDASGTVEQDERYIYQPRRLVQA